MKTQAESLEDIRDTNARCLALVNNAMKKRADGQSFGPEVEEAARLSRITHFRIVEFQLRFGVGVASNTGDVTLPKYSMRNPER